MTCLQISESEDFPRGNFDCTSAENQDAYIAPACVDATFDSAFDAGRRNFVVDP